MNSRKFFALIGVSSVASIMLIIDGAFSRIAANQNNKEGIAEQVGDFAFWPLWLPLLLVQIVVIALSLRSGLHHQQRNIIIFMLFLFLSASMYSLIGHVLLTK